MEFSNLIISAIKDLAEAKVNGERTEILFALCNTIYNVGYQDGFNEGMNHEA